MGGMAIPVFAEGAARREFLPLAGSSPCKKVSVRHRGAIQLTLLAGLVVGQRILVASVPEQVAPRKKLVTELVVVMQHRVVNHPGPPASLEEDSPIVHFRHSDHPFQPDVLAFRAPRLGSQGSVIALQIRGIAMTAVVGATSPRRMPYERIHGHARWIRKSTRANVLQLLRHDRVVAGQVEALALILTISLVLREEGEKRVGQLCVNKSCSRPS